MASEDVTFSGWEVADDGASGPAVMLNSSQKPLRRGVYIMYHGTSVASARLIVATGFKQSTGGMLGPGVYVSRNKKKAACYPPKSTHANRVILELHVRVGRVKRIDKDNHPMQKTWHSHGYDTAWVPPNAGMQAVPSGREEDCVFNPKRVKVVGVAEAPTHTIKAELEKLLKQKASKNQDHRGDGGDACTLCKRKTQQGATHTKEVCWKCGDKICILMSKHFCSAKP